MDITKKAALVVGTTALVLGSAGAASAQDENYGNPAPATDPSTETPTGDGTDGGAAGDAPAAPAAPTPSDADVLPATPAAAPATPAAAPAAAPAQAAQQLPVTGGEATGLAALGAALVAGGGVLVWRSKGAAEA